ncbi:hypothetical protein SMC26_12875 [Actinomadura fulvescens]|uniref:Uncharacterized protein n=1 Tax=Actinomadura fulvescens TaxID=46160 RepID=A0ABN3PCQ5_9ACTN
MGTRRERLRTPPFLERRFIVAFGVAALLAGIVLRGLPDLVGEAGNTPPPQARALLPTERSGSPSPTPTLVPPEAPVIPDRPRRPSPSPTKPPESPVPQVNVEFPEPGQGLHEDRDFVVGGTVRDLGDDDLRIFIYAEERDRFYLADYRAERVGGARWEIRSTGIGIEWGGRGDPYLVQVVRADERCQEVLAGLELGNDHYPAFDALPPGCRVAAQVRVVEAG